MTDNPENPFAFPVPLTFQDGGMTLRDYFAAHVAQGMAAFSGTSGTSYGPHEIAGRSYQIADAMLIQRETRDD